MGFLFIMQGGSKTRDLVRSFPDRHLFQLSSGQCTAAGRCALLDRAHSPCPARAEVGPLIPALKVLYRKW
jgi:hypothetical protein